MCLLSHRDPKVFARRSGRSRVGFWLLVLSGVLAGAEVGAQHSPTQHSPTQQPPTQQQSNRAGQRYGALALMSLMTHQIHQGGLARIDRCLPGAEQAGRRAEMRSAWSRLHVMSLARAERILSPAFYERVPLNESDRRDSGGWGDVLALRAQLPLLAYLGARKAQGQEPDANCAEQLDRIRSGDDSMDRQLARTDSGYPALMALDLDHPERLGDPEMRSAGR